MVRKHDSSTRVLTFVLTVAFGLLSAVIAYVSFKGGSFELRSKAATEEVILKQWTFDKVAEGWEAKDFLSSTITGGMYKLTPHPNKQIAESKQECTMDPKQKKQVCKQVRVMRELTPQIFNTSVATNLKYPVNKFRIRLAVLAPQAVVRRSPTEKDGKMVPSQAPQKAYPFTIKVTQKYQGKKPSFTEQQISAVADGKEHEYSFEFSKDSSLKRVDELSIQFVSLPEIKNTTVSINDIALIGLKKVPVVPTPTKTPPQEVVSKAGLVQRYSPDRLNPQYMLVVINPIPIVQKDYEEAGMDKFPYQERYLLTQNTVNPCGTSKTSKLMCRYFAPPVIDFSKYVDKLVTVTGMILEKETTDVVNQGVPQEWSTQDELKELTAEDDAMMNRRPPNDGVLLPTFVVKTIRLVTTPSISPSPVVCGTGLKDLSPGKSTTCKAGDYLGMKYTCWDGSTGMIDEGTICRSYDVLKQKVTALCTGRTNCPKTSVAPITPTSYPSQYPTPTPWVSQYPTPTPWVSQYPTSTLIPTPIASRLEILSPNGGETLTIGNMYTIKWNSTNNFENIDLQYATDGGFASFIGRGLSDTGSFTWQVNSLFGNGNYKIFIYGYSNGYMTGNDNSNNYFTITN